MTHLRLLYSLNPRSEKSADYRTLETKAVGHLKMRIAPPRFWLSFPKENYSKVCK
ncbi:hypothetical protein LP7551_02162 [Roseibium album]|nr:hypothetical protein LP7551_02162 [Roseibium album]